MFVPYSRENEYIILKKYKEYAVMAIQPSHGKAEQLTAFETARWFCFHNASSIFFIFLLDK